MQHLEVTNPLWSNVLKKGEIIKFKNNISANRKLLWLYIHLFWLLHIIEIIDYMALYHWLLSFSIIFPRFIHVHDFILFYWYIVLIIWASLVGQTVKNPPAMQETWVGSLGWEDPLEEGMVTHSSILAWRIPMDRGAWRATVHGITKSWTRLSE